MFLTYQEHLFFIILLLFILKISKHLFKVTIIFLLIFNKCTTKVVQLFSLYEL